MDQEAVKLEISGKNWKNMEKACLRAGFFDIKTELFSEMGLYFPILFDKMNHRRSESAERTKTCHKEEENQMKEMLKRLGSALLAVAVAAVLFSAMAPHAWAEETEEPYGTYESLTYIVTDEGTVTIIGCNENVPDEVVIPPEIEGHLVTAIGEGAFVHCEEMTHVTIPESVTSIGAQAFQGCYNLTSVEFSDSVSLIGQMAFANCSVLADVFYSGTKADWNEIEFGENAVPEGATYHFEDGEVSLTEGIDGCLEYRIVMEDGRFYVTITGHTDDLPTELEIPAQITGLPVTCIDNAFSFCYSLKRVEIPESITSIENGAFYNCSNLAYIALPSKLASIGFQAFERCFELNSVFIPSSVFTISSDAFSGCSDLKTVFYSGTEEQWNSIRPCLKNGLRLCYFNKTAIAPI